MAVFRIEKTRDYTVMSNYHLRDRSLSLKAKGLLSLMLSLPEDWDYTMKGLARICKDGIDSISGGIRELETHGYLVRARVRNENGQLGSIEYTILEQPKEPAQTPAPIREKPIRENPIQVKPMLDAPIQENPTQLNTKEQNKELSITQGSSPIPSSPPTPRGKSRIGRDRMRERESYREIILENIDYDILTQDEKLDRERLDELVELMVDTVCSNREMIRVAGDDYPAEVVKSRFLKIDSSHIEYALERMRENTTYVRNIKKYLLAALYNAPVTMDSYYTTLKRLMDSKEAMSRLGRDYLQVGMYTEIMFPEHDIHFIAVNDGVDSTQGDNEFTPFRNIINEWYAKDTSKKIRAVMKVKGNAGEHLTTLPPYGYMKSPDNKKLWVRDEDAAAVVYEIGLYVMDGFGPSQIARKLTERRILTPAAYYASRGRKARNIKQGLPYAWDASTVADIMDRWREYLGHTVNFKTRKKSYKSKKVIHNPESEWMIFENTHDPIWTEAIADAARAARQTRRRPTKMGEMGMFSGMMFCADCGSVMYQCRATNFRREQEYYLCAGYRKSRDFCGQTHSIRTVILEELILENLREIVSFASRSKDEFVRLVMDSDLRQRNRDLVKRKRQLTDSEKRITELDAIFKRLYEDNISGKLSDERFQKLSADYEKEEQELKVLVNSLRKEVELEESKSADVDRFLSVVERYTDIPELTPCILHEFVEKIIVHAASDPKGKNRTQEIDIYYKGIGALEMSKVTASMEK